MVRVIVERGGVSEELARAAIERGGAFLRGKRSRDPSAQVRSGDRVDVTLEAPAVPPLSPAQLLHLDDRVIGVDKPAGVSAQEDLAGGPALPQLCTALLKQLGERETQALLVHRLDKGTTGVCVLARTRRAQTALLEEFREHRARKEYRALVAGSPPDDQGLIGVEVDRAAARTRWRVVERYGGAALISALPETGRTHQIRAHLRGIGLPLLGDTRYGGPAFVTRDDGARHDFARPMLHALGLEVLGLRLTAPPPSDFEAARAFLSRGR
ncbi:MAG: RluA family pseudouridine synthase [Myxococcales bacterium]|nr:RluA family pseudouridine synthase [Myxococcales bacterium]